MKVSSRNSIPMTTCYQTDLRVRKLSEPMFFASLDRNCKTDFCLQKFVPYSRCHRFNSRVVSMSSSVSTEESEHPWIFLTINSTLWLTMLVFVAFPFGLVSALLLLVLRPLVVLTDDRDLADLSDFIELCHYMPEMCLMNLVTKRDFVKAVSSRRPPNFNFGTPV